MLADDQEYFEFQSQSVGGPNVYDFHEELAMSHGTRTSGDIAEVLKANIPGAVKAEPAEETDDRNGTDWWVYNESGRPISIDAKIRKKDYRDISNGKEDDLALETLSVIECDKIGWTRDDTKQTDYILWWWKSTRRWCLVPFRMLCYVYQRHWRQWKAEYRTEVQETRMNGYVYHSECTFVPRKVVWREIYKHFGGDKRLPKKDDD
jgi:hypothetical protein